MSRSLPAAAALLAVALAVASPPAGRAAPQTPPLHWTARHGYRLLLPSGWRFLDASYPSDHFTDFYVDPTDPNARLVVVGSPCQHCVTQGLSSKVAFPPGVTGRYRLDRYRVSWSAPGASWKPFFVWGQSPADTYRLDGITWGGPALQFGYIQVGLWLPASAHATATRILDSVTLSNGVSFLVGHN